MTTLYMYSRPIGLRFEFDGYEESKFDPTSVSNGCWDQKLARVAAWCHGVVVQNFRNENTRYFALLFSRLGAKKEIEFILPSYFALLFSIVSSVDST
jgi:hypothetical protein